VQGRKGGSGVVWRSAQVVPVGRKGKKDGGTAEGKTGMGSFRNGTESLVDSGNKTNRQDRRKKKRGEKNKLRLSIFWEKKTPYGGEGKDPHPKKTFRGYDRGNEGRVGGEKREFIQTWVAKNTQREK